MELRCTILNWQTAPLTKTSSLNYPIRNAVYFRWRLIQHYREGNCWSGYGEGKKKKKIGISGISSVACQRRSKS